MRNHQRPRASYRCLLLILCVLSSRLAEAETRWHEPVDFRIANAVGQRNVPTFQEPDRIEVFRLTDEGTPEQQEKLSGYSIVGRGETLKGEKAVKVGELLLSQRTYSLIPPNTGSFKLCGEFSPGIGLRFWARRGQKGAQKVDVLICFKCDDLVFVRPDEPTDLRHLQRTLDIAPGRDALLALAAELFPSEPLWRSLRRKETRKTYLERQLEAEFVPDLLHWTDADRATADGMKTAQLMRALFRSAGVLAEDWYAGNGTEWKQILKVAGAFGPTVLLEHLASLRHDRLAMLGAAKLVFGEGLFTDLSPERLGSWPATLAQIRMEDGKTDDKASTVFQLKRWIDLPGVRGLLHRAATGEIAEKDAGTRSMIRPAAILMLAYLNDPSARGELQAFAPQSEEETEHFRVARALLGEKDQLAESAFGGAWHVRRAAYEAVRRAKGAIGLPWLVKYGLQDRGTNRALAVEAFAEIVREEWTVPPGSGEYPGVIERVRAIEAWWKEHGTDFVQRHAR